MKILSIGNCELSPFLGSGKTRLRWSEGFRALGHEFDTLAPDDFEWMPSLPSLKRLRLAYGARRRMWRALREKPYDIVEFFGGELGWATRALAGLRKRPLIIAHTDGLELLAYYNGRIPEDRAPGSLWNLRAYYNSQVFQCDYDAFRCADRFASGSWQDQRFVVSQRLFEEEETAVVAPGIDSEFLGRAFVPGDRRHLAYAGSWIERKNPQAIVRVVTALLMKRPELTFNVFGVGGAADEVLRSFPENLREQIKVHPKLPTSELAAKLSQSAVFFFPSRYEGFGMTLAEAMGCSCAVVTTPTGFGAELQDGSEALICDFEDTAGMKRDIEHLLDHDDERHAIARAGWERVQRLQWDQQVAKLESSYQRWFDAWKDRVAVPR